MCPVKLCEYMHRGRECEDYIVHVWKIQDEKNYIIGAFHESNHWMLIVTCLGLNTIYILDSDRKNPKRLDIKKRLQNAWSIHCMQGGRRNFNRKNNKLIIKDDILCPQQPKDYECGYYVMKWMYNITFYFSSKKEEEFVKLMEESSMSSGDIHEIKEEWATKCLENL
ncbi:uncharacterized protein LOC141602659 [Silene latifolia]|uniref:uncharacterized protein LOC141602659 n=1 Tax=Silene latifolia TaxID=37657 RepID=UPI003D78A4F1